MQKGQTQVLILAGIVLVLALAGGIFFLGRVTVPKPPASQRGEQTPVVTSSPQPSPTPTDTSREPNGSVATVNWKTYIDTKYRFSIKYPQQLRFEVFELGQEGVLIGPSNTDTLLEIKFLHNPSRLDLSEAIKNIFIKEVAKDDLEIEQSLELLSNYSIGGQPSTKTEIIKGSTLDKKLATGLGNKGFYEKQFILTPDRNWLIGFDSSALDSVLDPAYRGLSTKILSTFKFLP